MKTFEEELQKEIDNQLSMIRPGMDGVGYDGGFIDGLEYVQEMLDEHKNEAINEILTKYMEWVDNTPRNKFADWLCEEGDYDKNDARIRKEFIEFLKREQ